MSEPENSRPPRDNFIRAVAHEVNVRGADNDDGPPVLFGHFARFNEWTEIDSFFEGHFMERFAPGAFKKTIDEQRSKMRVLFQHGQDPQIGDKPIAEITDLREDDQGAYYEARLFDGLPDLIVDGLRAGQYGASFRFKAMIDREDKNPTRSEHNPRGLKERTVVEARVPEFGPVTFPAYANATAGVRSMTDDFLFDWIKREPARARELIGSVDLRDAAFSTEPQEPAPTEPEAAPVVVAPRAQGGRATRHLYGQGRKEKREPWRL